MKKSAQSRRSALIVAAVAAVGLAIVLCIPQALRSAQYSRAEQALASGAYAQAHDGFAGLGVYRDSEALCAYAGALHLLTQGAYAEALGASEEQRLRALALANLISVHQKKYIGSLSAYCGAVSAATGAACGVAYLKLKGKISEEALYQVMSDTITNSICTIGGMVCDGAKSS